ncbi:MAG: NUDIX hydrolase [Polyangiales bacterium]
MPIDIEILEDRAATTPSDKGFLKVRRLRLRSRYEDGSVSDPYPYDCVDRAALDAVAVLLWSKREGAAGDPWVCLRTALRPPLVLRRTRELPVPDPRPELELWELPAGLIEAGERGEEGVRACAKRETEEETGYDLPLEAFALMGRGFYLSPGMCAEKIFVVRAEVPDRDARPEAKGDGVIEQGARVEWVTLSDALARCDAGEVEDAKTEVALRRFSAGLPK